jgi:hypothetical protein
VRTSRHKGVDKKDRKQIRKNVLLEVGNKERKLHCVVISHGLEVG